MSRWRVLRSGPVGGSHGDAAVQATVSVGGAQVFTQVEGTCPTFSRGGVDDATAYEIVVYGVEKRALAAADPGDRRPVLRVEVPDRMRSRSRRPTGGARAPSGSWRSG